MTESFAELFEQSEALTKLKPGTIVSGIIVEIRSDGSDEDQGCLKLTCNVDPNGPAITPVAMPTAN